MPVGKFEKVLADERHIKTCQVTSELTERDTRPFPLKLALNPIK
jgi:hypothetical protein